MINKIHNGDVLDVMAEIPNESIDSVITSPPYWQLRDYGYPEQLGLEPTYQEYLEHLWALMDEIWRVLKDSGTVWINLGDTYGGLKGGGASSFERKNAKNWKDTPRYINSVNSGGSELNKCLLLIPHRFAIGCIDRGWVMRNDIIWAKRNGMPESVTDRFSKKHEYIFFMTKKPKYYFDLDAIREKQKDSSLKRYEYDFTGQEAGKNVNFKGSRMRDKSKEDSAKAFITPIGKGARPEWHPNGKNPGDVSDFWDITTKGNSEKHYAAFNFKLIEKPIVAGSPEGGVILDPFCGKGTTLVRALQLNRQVIGIDGSKEYCKIAERDINKEINQLKMFND